jgi:1,2-phenylacetyl-CoA epoxidase PaaB subunit
LKIPKSLIRNRKPKNRQIQWPKRQMTKEQTTIYETLHRKRKLNIEQHKPQ